jgi:hypothetical protein
MSKPIPNYANYIYDICTDTVLRVSDSKVMPKYPRKDSDTTYYKLKNDDGIWKQVGSRTVKALTSEIKAPEGFNQVPKYPELYISREGKVWSSPTATYPLGCFLSIYYPKGNKYPTCSPNLYGKLAIHQLLALTYIDEFYLESGLCVMHLDDDKHNFNLLNLKIGTYSENNKAAYDSGANPGNGK